MRALLAIPLMAGAPRSAPPILPSLALYRWGWRNVYASAFGGRSSVIRRLFSSVTKESMLLRNPCRSAGVIGLAAISSHPKRTLSFNP